MTDCNLKFKRTLQSKATIKKMESYDFKEFSEKDINEARKHNFQNPLFLDRFGWYALYEEDGFLVITMFHSYDKFKEIKEEKLK